MSTLRATHGLSLFAVLSLLFLGAVGASGCGGGSGHKTTGDTGTDADGGGDALPDVPEDAVADADVSDVETEPQPATLGLVYAFSHDGSQVGLLFNEALDETAAADASHYALAASNDSTATVTGATADGDYVTLTLDQSLDPAAQWDVTVTGLTSSEGHLVDPEQDSAPVMATVYLNLIWHQHQPSYLDPALDELQGPWVRKHATKDYFDMTAILAGYPDIHLNVNLTSSLLNQLDLYIDRLGPYVDVAADSVDESAFLAAWGGHTDPWIDLLLNDTPAPADLTADEIDHYYGGVWSMRSISDPLRAFFPEYDALLNKASADYTQLDLLYLKLYFEIAWMDPDFLNGPVTVYHDEDTDSDVVVDLSDVVNRNDDGTYVLDPYYTTGAASDEERLQRGEDLANRLVAEEYEIMRGVFAIHKSLLYSGGQGQVEVLTTPFYHPILPLLYDTDLAAEGQPNDPLPEPPFSYPEDVFTQIQMAVQYYTRRFGTPPTGMWPSEGAVAEEVIPAFVGNHIQWIATDRRVLERGLPGASYLYPYRIDADTVVGDGGNTDDEMMIVFRDTALADAVSFQYQSNPGDVNAASFLESVRGVAPRFGERDRLLTVVADGENAWEYFTVDHDAKDFFHAVYGGLSQAFERQMIITVTGSEYVSGDVDRGVPVHPLSGMDEYENLFPGSWVDGTLATWIGELEENLGWTYLRTARVAVAAAKAQLEGHVTLNDSLLDPPDDTDVASYNWWRALRALYAAEGSDWFWWYGSDQTSAGGDDTPFDNIFRAQLRACYEFMNNALDAAGQPTVDVPAFPPIIQPAPARLDGAFTTVPTLDGQFSPDDSEWIPPAGGFWDNDAAGAELDPNDVIKRVLFGYQTLPSPPQFALYFAIELNEDATARLGTDFRLALYTSQGHLVAGDSGDEVVSDPANAETEEGVTVDFRGSGPSRQILLDFSSGSVVASLANADGEGGWTAVPAATITVGGPTGDGTLIELKVPFADLGMAPRDPFEFMVVAAEGNTSDGFTVLDIAPNLGTQVMFVDPTQLVTVIFELDATGSQIALSQYTTIANPPPPEGTGEVSIVGNQDDFAQWTPNTVFMADDGVDPDTTAGDNIWTRSFAFSPGVGLQYKYTIGASGDSWGGTEEYPLTNRGYTVPLSGTRRVRVRDVFADRPNPSGSMADLTQVTVEE